jgi:hypothetical protein
MSRVYHYANGVGTRAAIEVAWFRWGSGALHGRPEPGIVGHAEREDVGLARIRVTDDFGNLVRVS